MAAVRRQLTPSAIIAVHTPASVLVCLLFGLSGSSRASATQTTGCWTFPPPAGRPRHAELAPGCPTESGLFRLRFSYPRES